MNCDEARALFLAGEADGHAGAHLAECSACRRVREELERRRAVLVDPATWEVPPRTLEDEVVASVGGMRRTTGDAGGPPRWIWAVAAAAIVAIVAIAALVRSPAPDWEVTMPGTDLAPGAVSTVAGWQTGSGTRMVLTVEGLEPAPEGSVYELWLSGGGAHVSAGTFTGSGEIEVWAGVSRSQFPRLWVTIEPVDAEQGPSGATVLDTGP